MRLDGIILLSRWDMERIGNALVYVEKHYRKPISADHLSLEVSLSKEKLQAGIHRKTGLTLHLHILRLRTEKAKELLRDTDHPVKFIAAATGFKTASHFIDTFKRFQAQTPHQYRIQLAV
ncbi:MAG TPA: AraC family transcriptional regulator [Puia sp.]|nr:AraC family transcriptional regulator [Puia sp.]